MFANIFARKMRTAGCVVIAGLVLAACQTVPPYHPQEVEGGVGFSDKQLAQNRYRITFSGGISTHRNDVEDYLLRRAAEVTQQAGFTHFRFEDRDTEAKNSYDPSDTGFGPYDRWGGWRHGSRSGPWYWSGWDGPQGFGDSFPTTRYTAYAEIVMFNAAQAANDPSAIEAKDVLNHLGAQPSASPPGVPPPPVSPKGT